MCNLLLLIFFESFSFAGHSSEPIRIHRARWVFCLLFLLSLLLNIIISTCHHDDSHFRVPFVTGPPRSDESSTATILWHHGLTSVFCRGKEEDDIRFHLWDRDLSAIDSRSSVQRNSYQICVSIASSTIWRENRSK